MSDIIGVALLGIFALVSILIVAATLTERLMLRVKRLFRKPNP